MSIQSSDSDFNDRSVGDDRTRAGNSIIPMKALYERIDLVRNTRTDLPNQLRNIADEIPSVWTRKTLNDLATALQQNMSSPQLVARFPQHCWLLTLQSSAATTEALTAMLEQAAFQSSLQTKKLRTIAYPMVLLVVAIAIMLVIVTMLVPSFDEMYQEFALRLPGPTMVLVHLSRLVTGHPIGTFAFIVIALAGLAGVLWLWIGDTSFKRTLFGASINAPTMRQSLAKVALQVAELSDEGIGLSEALKIAAESNPDTAMRSLVADLAIQTSHDGRSLQKSRAAMIFPPNFLFALNPVDSIRWTSAAAAEPTPPNSTMLRELAASYRDLSIGRKDWVAIIIGQTTVIGVGLMIAFVVVSLFAPLISLVSALSS